MVKKYCIDFHASERNAIGRACDYFRSVTAESFELARLLLSDDFDHILIKKVDGQEYDPLNPPK